MNVNILGFKLEFSNNISIGEFYQALESIENQELKIAPKTYISYLDIKSGYIIGLILSYKTNKKSLATKRDNEGDLIVTISEMAPGEYMTEANVFCINPYTLKGLVYSYIGSTSANAFKSIFRKCHSNVVRYKKKDYKNELTNFGEKKVENLQDKLTAQFFRRF